MNEYSFIIPVYNEEQTIENVILDIQNKCSESEFISSYEIIIVDDNSNDNSSNIISKFKKVKYLKNLNNFGYGFSLKKGIINSKYSNIVIIDGDGTYPVEYLDKLIKEYNMGYDLVIGKRTGKNLNLSPFKKPMRMILKFIVEYATGTKIPDINSGFRVINKEKILKNLDHLSNAFSFTTSMTMTFIYSKYSISYIDIPYELRNKSSPSKVRLLKDSLRTLQYIIKIILFFDKIKLFVLISFILFVLSLLLFLISFYKIGLLTPGFLTFLVSILVFCIGMLSETINKK
ncbi:glycosyltransferase family 2 protein [Candidatus Pelagibacter sp.]|uniref:glycosyltransferase family 2 protein n=1 Tax=Candidatus Pelagibacter sp. TaxID=2024849 RepID=UPI003F82730A